MRLCGNDICECFMCVCVKTHYHSLQPHSQSEWVATDWSVTLNLIELAALAHLCLNTHAQKGILTHAKNFSVEDEHYVSKINKITCREKKPKLLL